jgi:HEAT repeat protein
MKKLTVAYIVLAIIVLLVTSIKAGSLSQTEKDNIVRNLSTGLISDNSGLRVSSALVLGRLIDINYIKDEDAKSTVLALMKMLNKGDSEQEKISAALALFKIGDAKGIYQLKGSSKFDDSKRVQDICHKLYSEFQKQNRTEYLQAY